MTLPAHSSMMTGNYPPTHAARLNDGDHLAGVSVTLAEILQQAGYQTAAFVGGFPLHFMFGLNQGFDTYDGEFTKKGGHTSNNERTAAKVAESRKPSAWWISCPRYWICSAGKRPRRFRA